MKNSRDNFGWPTPFVFELEARTRETDRRTDGQQGNTLNAAQRTAAYERQPDQYETEFDEMHQEVSKPHSNKTAPV